MKFVEEHLTTHHLFHKPHRWFLAFLLSPFHAAAKHYANRYHLRYVHAKKVFTFDLLLLFSTLILIGATLFLYTYDPSVTSFVSLTITPSTHDEAGQPTPIDRLLS